MKNFWNRLRDITPVAFIMTASFVLPLHKHIMPILIMVWAGLSLFIYRWPILFRSIKASKFPVLIFVLLYLMTLLALLLFTENKDVGVFKLEVKLSYVILPFLLLPLILFTTKQLRILLILFVAGCVLSDLICLVNAAINYPKIGQSAFYYTSLSVFHHTSYFAMYQTFAIAILLFDYLKHSQKKNKFLYVLTIFFLSFMIFLLSSKAGLIVMLVEFLAFGTIILFNKFSFLKLLGVVAIVALCGILVVSNYRVVSTTSRLVSVSQNVQTNKDSGESTQARILVWNASLRVFGENWLYGTSPGDASDDLVRKYHQLGFSQAELKKLNCHNQYIETLISLGVIGFIVLLAIFIVPIAAYGFKHNLLFVFLLGICGINFLFESMLETQSGIIFFVFFYIYFVYTIKQTKNDTFLTATH